jgi:hypothetical protein
MGNVTTTLRTVEVLDSRTTKSVCLESKLNYLDSHICSATILHDTLVVDCPLKGYSYLVARSGCRYQLTFILKDGRQVNVTIEPSGNIVLVAQKIADLLTGSGNRLMRLALAPATQVYQRGMN